MNVADLGIGLVALLVLLFPGWLAARAMGAPYPLVAGFVTSALAIFSVILALEVLSVPFTRVSCGSIWIAATLIAGWLYRRSLVFRRAQQPTTPYLWRRHWPLLVALIPGLVVVTYRASTQALFGIDTIFRWNYLAEQMFARGSLAFYPPVSAADYEIYSWPDGIAPLVSALYFWIYSFAGAARRELTGALVVFQYVLILIGTFGLARRYFSDRAAAFACALVACSPVVAWATAMGQETGLTAISLLGLLLYLPINRAEENLREIAFAAGAASLGALAREYGLVFPCLGLALLIGRRISWKSIALFAVVAGLITLPWYCRNWSRTGNPFFSLDLAGWFPINQEHAWLNESYHVEFGWSNVPPGATWYVVRNCFAILFLGAFGVRYHFIRSRSLLVSVGLVAMLWAGSVGYTAAGFTNAIRVLSPALALGAVLGGAACARWIPDQKFLKAVGVAFGLLGIDAAFRTLTLPGNVYKIPLTEWFSAGRGVHEYHARRIYGEFVRVAAGHRILVLGPNALLSSRGARTVPLWSPEVRFLFDPTLPPSDTARRLRGQDIEFVLLNRGPANERYLARSRFFRDPEGTLKLVWADGDMVFHHVEPLP